MEESERVCKGAHRVGWQSLVPLDLRLCRATSVGNVVKCGINNSKRLGRAGWPQFPLLLHYQTLLNHSDLRDDPWASPAHTGPDERPPRRTPGPSCWALLGNRSLYSGQFGLSQNLHSLIFILTQGKSKYESSPLFHVEPALLYFFLSRLNLLCSLFILPSTSFSRSLYHPGSSLWTHFGLLLHLIPYPVLQISIESGHSIIAPKITWGFPLFICYWLV